MFPPKATHELSAPRVSYPVRRPTPSSGFCMRSSITPDHANCSGGKIDSSCLAGGANLSHCNSDSSSTEQGHIAKMLRVGVVGLGRMGSGMALNVAKAGFPLAIYDAEEGRTQELREGWVKDKHLPTGLSRTDNFFSARSLLVCPCIGQLVRASTPHPPPAPQMLRPLEDVWSMF